LYLGIINYVYVKNLLEWVIKITEVIIKILIIEKDLRNVQLLEDILKNANDACYKIEKCKSISETIIYLQKSKCDVILCSLNLPDLKGADVIKKVLEIAPKVPVILMVEKNEEDIALQALKMGIQDFFFKEDLTSSLLNRSIRYVIEKKELKSPLLKSESKLKKIHSDFNKIVSEKNNNLSSSEEHYKYLFETPFSAIIILDHNLRIINCNTTCEIYFGYTKLELENTHLMHLSIFSKTNQNIILQKLKSLKTDAQFIPSEYNVFRKDGSNIWVTVAMSIVKLKESEEFLMMFQDITDRYRTEKKLKTVEEQFKIFGDHSYIGIFLLQDGEIKYVNEKVSLINGYSIQEMLRWSIDHISTIIHPEDQTFIIEQAKKKERGDADVLNEIQYRIISKSGNIKWVNQYSKTILYNEKTADLCLWIDITNNKMVIEEAIRSGIMSQNLFENNPFCIFLTDFNGQILNANKAFLERLGISLIEIKKKKIQDIVKKDGKKLLLEMLKTKFKETEFKNIKISIIDNDGFENNFQIYAMQIEEYDQSNSILFFARDITERRLFEERFKDSENKLAKLIETIPLAILISNPEGEVSECNFYAVKVFGYDSKDELLKIPALDHYDDQKDRKKFLEMLEKRESVQNFEVSFKRKDQTKFFASMTSSSHEINGQTYFINAIDDISERKKIEELIKDLAKIPDEAPYPIMRVSADFILYLNEPGKILFDLKPGNRIPLFLREKVKECLQNHEIIIKELNLNERFYSLYVTPVEGSDYINIYAIEITELMEKDEKLKLSLEKYKNLVDNLNDGVLIMDLEGKILYASPQIYDLTGYTPNDIIGKTGNSFIHPKDLNIAIEAYKKVIKQKKKVFLDYQIIDKAGKYIDVSASGLLIKIDGDDRMLAVMKDVTEKLISEQKLKESEEKYRHLFEFSPYYILLLNQSWDVLDCNYNIKEILGYSKEEIIGRNAIDIPLMDKNKLDELKKRTDYLFEGKKLSSFEMEVPKKDGTIIWVKSQPSLVRIGDVQYIYIISMDISNEKLFEKKLKESEQKFGTIANESLLGIAIIQDDLIKYMNERFADFLQYSVQEIENWAPGEFKKFIHPDDRSLVTAQVEKKQKGLKGIIKHYQYRIFKKDDTIKWLDNYSNTIIYEGRSADLVTVIDITDQKNTEQKLKDSEEKYKHLFETSPNGLILLNIEGKILECNSTLKKIIGYSESELIGNNFIDLPIYIDNGLELLQTGLNDLINKNELTHIELQIKTKEQTLNWIQIRSSLIELKQENIILTVIIDITSDKKIEQMKSDLLMKLSHEFKTPLISIKGFSEFLIKQYHSQLDEKAISYLNNVVNGSDRLRLLINSFIDSFQLDDYFKKYARLDIKEIYLFELIKNAVKDMEGLSKMRNHKIHVNINNNIKVNVDKEKMYSVIVNLLLNAIKYTQKGGEITIRSEITGNFIQISIKDTGIGLRREDQDNLFKAFGKINLDKNRWDIITDGMGMGLYLSKEIILLHGGKMWVESEGIDKGSTFYFTIPLVIAR